jgi:hypothetical protein
MLLLPGKGDSGLHGIQELKKKLLLVVVALVTDVCRQRSSQLAATLLGQLVQSSSSRLVGIAQLLLVMSCQLSSGAPRWAEPRPVRLSEV